MRREGERERERERCVTNHFCIYKTQTYHLLAVNSSSQISDPIQVSIVEMTPSPKGTVYWPQMLETILGK